MGEWDSMLVIERWDSGGSGPFAPGRNFVSGTIVPGMNMGLWWW